LTLFSIIIPCYNQAHFLKECVNSVLAQDFGDWEIIIVNDGSTDNTLKVALDFAQKDQRINVIDKENGGLSSARNAGIRQAKGKWLLFLDADDYVLSNYFKTVLKALEDLSSEHLLQYGYQYVEEDSNRTIFRKSYSQSALFLIPTIFNGNIGPCHSMVISPDLVSKIGYFDESLKSAEDWDFWIRAAKVGAKVKQIDQVLVAYRYSKDSMSRNAFRMYEALKTVAKRAVNVDNRIQVKSAANRDYDFDCKPVIKKALLQCLGVSIMQGKVKESTDLFRKEVAQYSFTFQVQDFAIMCSYLSFRYWYSKADLKRVFQEIYPLFNAFFEANPIVGLNNKAILSTIFERHQKQYNVQKFGFIGRIINKLTFG